MTSNSMLVLALVLLALTGLAAVLLPQIPPEIDQPDAVARWAADAGRQYGGLGGFLEAAGMFDLRHSAWTSMLMGLLAFVLLLRLAQSGSEAAARLGSGRDPSAAATGAQHWPLQAQFTLGGNLTSALDELSEDLRSEGWQVLTRAEGTTAHLSAERSTWGIVAPLLVYGGSLLILVALWFNQVLGWQEAGITLVPDQPVALARGPYQTMMLTIDETGEPVIVATGDEGQQWIRAFSGTGSVRFPGVGVRPTGDGPSLSVIVRDQNGNPLQLRSPEIPGGVQASLNLVFDQPRAERAFFVVDRELAFSVVAFPALPERGFAGPTFLVQAFEASQREPSVNEFLEGNTTLPVGEDTYTLTVGRFVTVTVSSWPGIWLAVMGALTALAGAVVGLWRPAGRLYVRLRGLRGGVDVMASVKASPGWRKGARWLAAWTATYEGDSVS